MTERHEFSDLRELELTDRAPVQGVLDRYGSEVSELTFTNLYIWRAYYGLRWTMRGEQLVLFCLRPGKEMALPPLGPGPRADTVRRMLAWMRDERGLREPVLERADERLAAELRPLADLVVEPQRAQFDYVYRTEDLIRLAGRSYHGQRNQIAQFERARAWSYAALDETRAAECAELADAWCGIRRCEEDLSLSGEREAIGELLRHPVELGVRGGLILVGGRVKAFSLGERMNADTALIHVEKADPELRGLYPLLNRTFCREAWSSFPFVNREQDLGEEGLRRAKMSYRPVRLVEKFRVRFAAA